MVFRRQRLVGTADFSSGEPQAFERLGARHFVYKLKINVEKIRRPIFSMLDNVISPNLLGKSAAHECSFTIGSTFALRDDTTHLHLTY
jgi:hypothetical protein